MLAQVPQPKFDSNNVLILADLIGYQRKKMIYSIDALCI